jgi:hypothetical protein
MRRPIETLENDRRRAMKALRLIVDALLNDPAARQDQAASRTARTRIYDPYSLATRPLPVDLRIHPHPRGLSAIDVLRITGGITD